MKFASVAVLAFAIAGVSLADSISAPTPATKPAAEKVNNTKCIVTGEAMMGKGSTVTHNGKEYNLCCAGCREDFEKDPDKFVKALDADPAKFGVKKEEKPAK